MTTARLVLIDITEVERDLQAAQERCLTLKMVRDYLLAAGETPTPSSNEPTEIGSEVATAPLSMSPPTARGRPPAVRKQGDRDVDTVARVMSDGQVWSVNQVHDAMIQQGWVTTARDPYQMIRTLMTRLVDRGTIGRVSRGRFRVVEPTTEAQPPGRPSLGPETLRRNAT